MLVSLYRCIGPFFVSTRSLKCMDDQNLHSAIQASKVVLNFNLTCFLKPKNLMSFRRWFFPLKFRLVSHNFCLSQVGNVVSFPRYDQVVPAMVATWHCWYRPVEHHCHRAGGWSLTTHLFFYITNHKFTETRSLRHKSLGKIFTGCFEVEISPDFGTCSVAYQLGAGHGLMNS